MLRFDREPQPQKRKHKKLASYYEVQDQPILIITLLLSVQHLLAVQGSTIYHPKLLSQFLCTEENSPIIGLLVGSATFMSGLGTFVQATVGIRLPVFQRSSLALKSSALAELRFNVKPCPQNATSDADLWRSRVLQVQATLAVGAITELLMGAVGLVGMMQRWMTPLTMTPIITLVGISTLTTATEPASTSWTLSGITVISIALLSHYLRRYNTSSEYILVKRMNDVITFLTILPILFTVAVVWLLCHILTVNNYFPEQHPARTDNMAFAFGNATWFRIPYPRNAVQWGMPIVNMEAIISAIIINLLTIMESVCDYYACAIIAGFPPPPPGAVNRAIFTEGFGCCVAGLLGCGLTYETQTIHLGVLAVTKVAAMLMILLGVMTKVGVFVLSIPAPIIGGLLLVLLPTFTGVGLSHLRYVDLTSNRNVFIIGVSLTFGIIVPSHIGPPASFNVTSTEEERGILKFREGFSEPSSRSVLTNDPLRYWHAYSTPCFEKLLKRFPAMRKLPLMPEKENHTTFLEEE
ncbi:hypothetical protein ISCGN_027774 [Ixodes scapularis]